jgi:hypothetical protein
MMNEEDEKPPILGSWNNIYILVLSVFVLIVILLFLFTWYFQ